MIFKYTGFIFLFHLFMFFELHSQEIIWGRHLGGSGTQYVYSTTYDQDGNLIYGGASHTSKPRIFFGKVAPDGTLSYNITLEGESWGYVFDVETDDQNNIYITGAFDKRVDFDPGFSKYELYAGSNFRIFVAKYESSGKFLWAKRLGSGSESFARGLALDQDKNVIITGSWNEDVFFTKLDYTNGNEIFTKRLECKPRYSTAQDVEVDANNNIYISGHIDDSIDFDPDTGTYFINQEGPFLAKYDSNGNFIWVKNAISSSGRANDIEMDNLGNIYMAGTFRSNLNFTPYNNLKIYSNGSSDMFIAKFDAMGNPIWQNGFGGITYDENYSLDIENDTSIFFGGFFRDSVYFGNSNLVLKASNGQDPFVARADSSGKVRKLLHFPSTSHGSLFDMTIKDGYLGVGGHYQGTIDLAPHRSGFTFYSGGSFSTNGLIASFCLEELGDIDSIHGPDLICLDSKDTFGFSVAPVDHANNYSWNLPPNYQIVGKQDTNIIKVIINPGAQTGNISVTAYGNCLNQISPTHQVIVPENDVNLTNTKPNGSCYGDTVSIIANYPRPYSVYIDSVFDQTITTDRFIRTGMTQDFDFYATYMDSLGCRQSTNKIRIHMIPSPDVKLTTDKTSGEICKGDFVNFEATGADTLSIFKNGFRVGNDFWSTNDIKSSDQFYAYGISKEGCSSTSDSISIKVNPLPVAGIVADPGLNLQEGQTVTFKASGGNKYDFYRNGTLVQSSSDSTLSINDPANGDKVYATVFLNDCQANTSRLTLAVSSDIPETDQLYLKIYPVPVDNLLKINFDRTDFYTITVNGTHGNLIKVLQLNANSGETIEIDLSQFPRSMYFINVQTNKGSKTYKIPGMN